MPPPQRNLLSLLTCEWRRTGEATSPHSDSDAILTRDPPPPPSPVLAWCPCILLSLTPAAGVHGQRARAPLGLQHTLSNSVPPRFSAPPLRDCVQSSFHDPYLLSSYLQGHRYSIPTNPSCFQNTKIRYAIGGVAGVDVSEAMSKKYRILGSVFNLRS
jgi:hypothetical protein